MANQIVTRSMSGLIYIGLVIAACLCGYYGVAVLATILAVLAIVEYKKMYGQEGASSFGYVLFDVFVVVSLLFGLPGMLLAILLVMVRMVMMIFSKSEHPEHAYMTDIAGYVYIGLPLACMCALSQEANTGLIVLAIFITIWLNDTGAYVVGSTFGRHKMMPRVSPKKSWEGLFGGMAFSVGFGVLLGLTKWGLGVFEPGSLRIIFWIVGTLLISIVSTFGDLFESALKRNLGLKDSGHLIPGHGGILDRIDSALMVFPVFYVFYMLVVSL